MRVSLLLRATQSSYNLLVSFVASCKQAACGRAHQTPPRRRGGPGGPRRTYVRTSRGGLSTSASARTNNSTTLWWPPSGRTRACRRTAARPELARINISTTLWWWPSSLLQQRTYVRTVRTYAGVACRVCRHSFCAACLERLAWSTSTLAGK
jgi:hypothetical protein